MDYAVAGTVRRGPHLPERVPQRPPVAGPGERADHGGRRRGRAALRHLWQRERLSGDAGDRHRRARPGQPAHGRVGGAHGAEAGGHQRRALPGREGRRGARRAAVHPDRLSPVRRRPAAFQLAGVLLQDRRGDAPGLSRLSRGGHQHPGGGRAVQRGDRAGAHAHTALSGARGVRRGLVSARAV